MPQSNQLNSGWYTNFIFQDHAVSVAQTSKGQGAAQIPVDDGLEPRLSGVSSEGEEDPK